jgi:ABC-type transporter Mla subunit MlaD
VKRRIRNFIDPVSSRTIEHPTRNGAILLLISLLVIVGAVSHKLPLIDSQSGYTIRADFAFVNNVNNRTPVRVRGVDVGVVSAIGPGPDPRRASELKMVITDSGLVVHSDAGAAVRWRTVLGGPMYIDLNPGSPDAPKLGDRAIPVARTSSQTEFDDVLRIYNGGTDQAQRDMLKGLSQGFGAPRATGTTIGSLQDLTTIGQGLKPYSGTIPGDLSRLVASTGQTAQALGANVGALQTLVSSADQTLGAVDQQRVALGQLLSLSPGTLDSTEVTMNRIRTTLNHLDPLVTHLLPAAVQIAPASHALQPALDRLNSLLIQAQPLLHDARPTLRNLRAASIAGVPVLTSLEPTINRLNSSILPWLGRRDSDTRVINYESIGPAFSVLDKAGAEYDQAGYRLHLSTLLGSASLLDEGVLTRAQSTFTSQCDRVAHAGQRAKCSTVASVLTGGLFGGPSNAH